MNVAGYQVDTGTVHGAGRRAITIGQNVSELAVAVTPASDVSPAPAGMEVGSTLLDVVPLWEEHLVAVGADVQRTGQNLTSTSTNYANAESTASQSFHTIQSKPS